MIGHEVGSNPEGFRPRTTELETPGGGRKTWRVVGQWQTAGA